MEKRRTFHAHTLRPVNQKRGERGFSLALVLVCLMVMLGMMGLAFDMGRMYIVKSELQAFADASALAAITQMDGTQAGIQVANSAAAVGPLSATTPNAYNFETKTVTGVTATYAKAFSGTYDSYATASSPATNNYQFVNVTTSAAVPMMFLPVLPGISSSFTLNAHAIAGQQPQSTISNGGLEPFMPDAHNAANTTNFGFTAGVEYTLKWGNGKSTCAGDSSWTDPNPASQHGFINLGQGNGNSSLTQLIVWGGYPNSSSTPSSVTSGMTLSGVPGNRGTQIFNSLAARAAQDTDDTSTTYAQYVSGGKGNGRRIVIVPIGDPNTWVGNGNGSEKVIGFGSFFLDPTYSGSNGAVCATFIGLGNLNGNGSGGTDGTKVYYNVLMQ